MLISLAQMKPKQTGIVVMIKGGCGLANRLESMGIRVSKKIKKVSSSFWHGPQTVEVNNMKIAVGFGMAGKILVEVEEM